MDQACETRLHGPEESTSCGAFILIGLNILIFSGSSFNVAIKSLCLHLKIRAGWIQNLHIGSS